MPIDCTQHPDQFSGFFKSAAGGHGLPLRQLFGVQLAAFSKQIDIQGPEVVLDIAPAICFAALVNELAVNAARVGALSLSTGRVSLTWFIEEQSDPATFRFRWEETGSPSVVSPQRVGFGPWQMEEIARDVGKTRIDYVPGGLKFEVVSILDEVCLHK